MVIYVMEGSYKKKIKIYVMGGDSLDLKAILSPYFDGVLLSIMFRTTIFNSFQSAFIRETVDIMASWCLHNFMEEILFFRFFFIDSFLLPF